MTQNRSFPSITASLIRYAGEIDQTKRHSFDTWIEALRQFGAGIWMTTEKARSGFNEVILIGTPTQLIVLQEILTGARVHWKMPITLPVFLGLDGKVDPAGVKFYMVEAGGYDPDAEVTVPERKSAKS